MLCFNLLERISKGKGTCSCLQLGTTCKTFKPFVGIRANEFCWACREFMVVRNKIIVHLNNNSFDTSWCSWRLSIILYRRPLIGACCLWRVVESFGAWGGLVWLRLALPLFDWLVVAWQGSDKVPARLQQASAQLMGMLFYQTIHSILMHHSCCSP